MFITAKRHEREKQEFLGASNRLTEAILKNTEQGLFLLDGKDRIQPQVSQSLATLFRRQDFSNLSFEKLIAPVVTAKMLTRGAQLCRRVLGTAAARRSGGHRTRCEDVEVRLPNADGAFDAAHYSFEFDPLEIRRAAAVAGARHRYHARVQTARELEDLRRRCRRRARFCAACCRWAARASPPFCKEPMRR